MKQLPTFACLAWILSCATGASAQSVEATRYVNPDGVEVIQARPQAQAGTRGSVVESDTGSVEPRTVKSSSTSRVPAAAAADPRLQVSGREQKARDKDRLAILNQELYKEIAEYETKSKVLRTPSMRGSLPDADLARLREIASDHEKNIKALMAEISGVRK